MMNVIWIFLLIVTAAAAITGEGSCATSSNLNEDETCDNYLQERTVLSTDTTLCEDEDMRCEHWAELGECEINPNYMKMHCQKSCDCCRNKEEDMVDYFTIMGGVPQITEGGREFDVTEDEVLDVISDTMTYLEMDIKVNIPGLLEICQNQDEHCAIWAAAGECTANPSYMEKECAPVCRACHKFTLEGRCPLDPNAPEAWKAGDLDKMFQRLSSEPYLSRYAVEVLSSPTTTNGPWVITMEGVVSPDEANQLIELGSIEGYKESTEVSGKKNADGSLGEQTSNRRTSYNAWCQFECYKNETAQNVIHRISNLTGIPETNSEYLQLLQYEKGQYYKVRSCQYDVRDQELVPFAQFLYSASLQTHIDFIEAERNRQQGNRILTVFLYLNDVVNGGETQFPNLNLTITPKLGRVLLWPNVLNLNPQESDPRTVHQALPVLDGIKYGANAWFHLRDFKTPNRNGCQ